MSLKLVWSGYKVSCLSIDGGYLYNFEVYQGKSSKMSMLMILVLALVLLLVCLNPYQRVIFQFLSKTISIQFLWWNIWNKTILAVVVQWKQICLRTVLSTLKANLKGDYQGYQEHNGGVEMVIWNDNGAVTIGSNCESIQPLTNCQKMV